MNALQENRILTRNEVLALTTLSNTSLYRLIATGKFPRPIAVTGEGGRKSGWWRSEVLAFLQRKEKAA